FAAADKNFGDNMRAHFARIAALETLGKREGDHLVFDIDLSSKDSRRLSERVLETLGIALRTSKQGTQVTMGERKKAAEKQETASALAVDAVGIQDALQAGQRYRLESPYDRVPLYPNEKLWREA